MVLAIVGAIIAWLHVNRKYENNNPVNYIPLSSVAVVKINGIDNYISQIDATKYSADLRNLGYSDIIDTTLALVDNLLKNSEIQSPALREREIYISFHAVGGSTKTNAIMLTFALNNYLEGYNIRNSISDNELYHAKDTTADGVGVLSFEITKGRQGYLTNTGGCLFLSDNPLLLSQIEQNRSGALTDDICFATLSRTASATVPFATFVNLGALDSITVPGLPIEGLTAHGSWAELDFECENNSIIANGFLTSDKATLVNSIVQQKSGEFKIDNYIPAQANIFLSYAAGKRGLANAEFADYLSIKGIADEYRQRQQQQLAETGTDIEGQLAELFAADIALFSVGDSLTDSEKSCLIIEAANGTLAQASLNAVIGALHKIETPRQCDELTPTKNVNIPVYEAFNDDDNLFFLDYLLPSVPRKYYLRYENTILIANTIELIRQTLYETMLNRTFGKDADFRNFRASFPDDNVMFYFCKSNIISNLARKYSSSDLSDDKMRSLGNFYGFGMQISSLTGLPYLTMSVYYEPTRIQMPPTAWQKRLDTKIIGRPYAVVNHNTQEIEYFVQDAANKVHLISPQGLDLWSHNVDSEIIGDVTQIDYYNNRKLQYLFCTRDHIYLIDRNGNNTACFPVRLPNNAVSGVTYIDYGNPKDFRLFVACDDKNICLFDREGQRIQGWEMPPTEGIVTRNLLHYESKEKDYLVVCDEYRCYITDRRGNERVKLPPLAPNARSNVYLTKADTDGAAFVMLTADATFAIANIATGDVRKVALPNSDGQQSYMVKLLNTEKFAIVAPDNITIVDADGKTCISEKISLSSVAGVELTPAGNIAVWDKDDGLGYLYDEKAKLIDGFPVPAQSQIVVTTTDKVEKVVTIGKDGELNCFLK